jgi:pimeloyl-ACP methyl ester carboxylesterase
MTVGANPAPNGGLRMKRLLNLCVAAAALALAACQSLPQGPAASPVVKRMDVNGVSLAYTEQGSGSPVVMVHGCCADSRAWDRHREAIAQNHRFIALDQRYWGTAPWPDKGEKYSVETQIEDLAAFVRGLASGPVHLVGWSLSGAAVLGVTVRHPELVKSVYVYEGSLGTFVTDPADQKAMADDRSAIFGPVVPLVKAGDGAAATRLAMDNVNAQPGVFDSFPSAWRAMQLDNARTLPMMFAAPPPPKITCEQLAQITVPVAVVRGELTRPSYRIMSDTASRCIPGSKLIVVPGARHLWPGQEPAAFSAAVLGFLGSQ